MSIFSFLEHRKEEVSLMIDIGNGSIAGGLVLFKEKSRPHVLYSTRLPFTLPEESVQQELVSSMVSLLSLVLVDISNHISSISYWKSTYKKVDHVLVTFSSPWFKSKTKHIELGGDQSFIITQKFIEDAIAREVDLYTKELHGSEYEKDFATPFEVVEKAIIGTKMNGYTMDNVIGKKTKSFEAYVSISIVSKNIIQKVSDTIFASTHIPKDMMFMHTFPLVSFSVIRNLFPHDTSFMMVDVSGETTDVTLVEDSTIIKTTSFPSGKNFIIREIAQSMNSSPEIAESAFHMYMEKKAVPTLSGQMENVLLQAEKEWSIYFENALLELSPKMNWPGKMFITADDDVAELYIEFLKLPKQDSTEALRRKLSPVHIQTETLSTAFTSDHMVPSDEFIAILAIFYSKFIKK